MELVLHTLIYPHLFIFFVVWETQVNLSTMHVLQIVSHCYKSQENWEEKKVSIVIHDFLRGFSNLATWFYLIRYDKKLSRHAFCQHPKDHDKIEKRSVTWTKKKVSGLLFCYLWFLFPLCSDPILVLQHLSFMRILLIFSYPHLFFWFPTTTALVDCFLG